MFLIFLLSERREKEKTKKLNRTFIF